MMGAVLEVRIIIYFCRYGAQLMKGIYETAGVSGRCSFNREREIDMRVSTLSTMTAMLLSLSSVAFAQNPVAAGCATNVSGDANQIGARNVAGEANQIGARNVTGEANQIGARNVAGESNQIGARNVAGEANQIGARNVAGEANQIGARNVAGIATAIKPCK